MDNNGKDAATAEVENEEESVRITFEAPESVRDGAKQKLPHGGMSEELRDTLTRIAFGEDMNQRSRLEKQKEDLKEKLREKREIRREADADIETLEGRLQGINEKLDQISTGEERYEAKLESLEYNVRVDGTHLDPGHGQVKSVAGEFGKSPEGVIKDLKHRNPDVPDQAFEEGMGADPYSPPDGDSPGLSSLSNDENGEDGEITPLEDREEKYRTKNPDQDE